MTHSPTPPHVGAQDPELRNSPIAMEMDEETDVLKQELPGEPVCYFNDASYGHGEVVNSAGTLLRCDRGLWVQSGEAEAP
jgi:hypothetical protein